MGFLFFPCIRDGLISTPRFRKYLKESEAELTIDTLWKDTYSFFSLFWKGEGGGSESFTAPKFIG